MKDSHSLLKVPRPMLLPGAKTWDAQPDNGLVQRRGGDMPLETDQTYSRTAATVVAPGPGKGG